MINKRGTHVGIILSFIIFMTFIFFIFIIVAPKVKTEGRNSFLEYLAQNVADNTSRNLTSVSFSTTSVPQTCLRISSFFTETGAGDSFVVKNELGTTVTSSQDGNDLLVVKSGSETFFKFMESDEFALGSQGTIGSCATLTKNSGYFLGLMKSENKVFESGVASLISAYEEDYDLVKEDLKVTDVEDFSFSLVYSNGTRLSPNAANTSILQGVSVYSDNFPIVYVDANSEIKSGFLGVSLWGTAN